MASTSSEIIENLEKIKEKAKSVASSSTQTSIVADSTSTAAAIVLSQSSKIAAQLGPDDKKITEESWLFKISKDNREFYLLGTWHEEPLSKFPPCVKDIVTKANTLITESHEQKTASEVLTEIIKNLKGFEKANENSYQKFNQSIRTKLENELKSIGQSKLISLLPKLKPWVIYVIFLYLEGIQKQASGMDHELYEDFLSRAKKDTAIILGLETRLDVIKAYKHHFLDLEECQKRMQQVESNEMKKRREIEREIFYSGNISKMIQFDRNYSEDDPVNIRNISWVKKIEEELFLKSKAPILVAVGVAHLYSGDNGLLSSFSKKGYTIERYNTLGQLKAFNWQAEFDQAAQAMSSTAAVNKSKLGKTTGLK